MGPKPVSLVYLREEDIWIQTERVNLKWLREKTTACILVGVVGELE